MGIFRSMGGVNLTGERIALGRGRSLDVVMSSLALFLSKQNKMSVGKHHVHL